MQEFASIKVTGKKMRKAGQRVEYENYILLQSLIFVERLPETTMQLYGHFQYQQMRTLGSWALS